MRKKSDSQNQTHWILRSESFKSLLTLAEATEVIPRINGRRFSSSTLWRWCRKGIRGVFLEHVCVGKALLTSKPALYRFFTELAKSERPLTSDNIPISSKNKSADTF